MIIEYVEGEDRDTVARWWLNQTSALVVAVLSETSERRLYSGKSRWDSRAHHSDRWDIPLPDDFDTLTDPTDVSVDSLLNAVRRGHAEGDSVKYVPQLFKDLQARLSNLVQAEKISAKLENTKT